MMSQDAAQVVPSSLRGGNSALIAICCRDTNLPQRQRDVGKRVGNAHRVASPVETLSLASLHITCFLPRRDQKHPRKRHLKRGERKGDKFGTIPTVWPGFPPEIPVSATVSKDCTHPEPSQRTRDQKSRKDVEASRHMVYCPTD